MYWKVIILAIIFYLFLRFFFRFVLPLLKVTHAATKKINELRNEIQKNRSTHHPNKTNPSMPKNVNSTQSEGDYIDFEEIKG